MLLSRILPPCWRVLDFPPPYSGMVAINSDVEWTNWSLQRSLLRTFADLDIECAFSYWFFAGGGQTWRLFGDDGEPTPVFDTAVEFMRKGIFDTVHSFGGRTHAGGVDFCREDILRGYRHLEESGVRTALFTNHGSEQDTQNIAGDWGKYQLGDVPGSDVYHLDRTLAHGVRFFWTDIDYVVDQPFLNAALNGPTALFRSQQCRDENHILCFRRFLGRLTVGPCAENLNQQIEQVLAAQGGGYSVVYQHLGVHRNADGRPHSAVEPIFPPECRERLEALADAQRDRRLLVTTTEKLLNHALLMAVRPWSIRRGRKKLRVEFARKAQIDKLTFDFEHTLLAGWAIRVPDGWWVDAFLDDEPVALERTEDSRGIVFHVPWHRISMGDALESSMAVVDH